MGTAGKNFGRIMLVTVGLAIAALAVAQSGSAGREGRIGRGNGTTASAKPASMNVPSGTRTKLPAGRQDIIYSLDVPIPHTPWAKPYYRGPVSAWILSPIVPNGDTIGLLKRFDIAYDLVSCDASWEMNTWGMGDAYDKRSKKQENGRDKELAYAVEDLTSDKHYDVMIIPTIHGWNTYPEAMRKAILRRVEEGAGLVLITPQDTQDKLVKGTLTSLPADDIALPALSPISGNTPARYHEYGDWTRNVNEQAPAPWKIVPGQEKHPILRGICWEEMPMSAAVAVSDYKTVAEGATVLVKAKDIPVVAVRQVGKGRVVAINWTAGEQGASLTPVEDESKCPTWDYWEQFYNLLGRATFWAAGKEPEVNITFGKYKDGKLTLETENALKAENEADQTLCGFRIISKDERGRKLKDFATQDLIGPGKEQHEIEIGQLPGGTNHVEVMTIRAGTGCHGWAATQIVIPKEVDLIEVKLSADAVKNGGKVAGSAALKGKGQVKVAFELRDPYGRILAKTVGDALNLDGQAKTPFEMDVKNPVSLAVFVRAIVTQGDKVICEKDSADVAVTPDEPKFSDYEVIPWGFTAVRNLYDVKAAQYRAFNATGNSEPTSQAMRAGFITKGHAEPERNTLGVYYYNAERGRLLKMWDDFKKAYKEDPAKADKSTLTRQICLSDPATLKSVEEMVRKKVRDQKKFNPGTYYIGDESSVTAYTTEAELDFCPKALDDFRSWCKARYGDIAKLNAKWQTDYKDFADIVPFVIQEAEKDPKNAIGWAEHRTFMEERYERVLELIRKVGKEEDPNAEFELTGTQSATSFNGIDWARHTRHVKRFVPYNINFAYDQLRCFNPGVKMAALTGYGSKGEGVKLSLWSQALHGLLSANIFWEWSLVNADMTLSQNAVDIGQAFGELRGKGIGRLISTMNWVKSPVAIYYSQPSIHAARVQGREGVCHNCRNAFCQVTRDLGLQFDMLSYFQVEEGKFLADSPAVLVLPAALAVSPKEAENILKYVENGGTVIADIDPAIADDRCDFRQNKLLEKLFGDSKTAGEKTVGKGKAILLGEEISAYTKRRGEKRGVEIRTQIGKLYQAAGATPTVAITVVDDQAASAPGVSATPAPIGPASAPRLAVPLARAETVVMQGGSIKLVGILKENLSGIRRTSEDGVEYFEPLAAGQTIPPEHIRVVLGAKPTARLQEPHVYNVRTGKYLGQTNVIDDELANGECKLYALLPYQVIGLKIKTDGKFAPGALLKITAEIAAARPAEQAEAFAPADHVFNVRVLAPDGAELPWHTRNLIAKNGKAEIAIPVELNPKGPFTVIITDVATGTSATLDLSK